MAKEKEEVGSYLNPDNAVAGGLRNQFEATVVEATFEQWDFKGKARPATTRSGKHYSGVKFALHLVLDDIDDGGKGTEDVWWPGLPIEECVPNDEGTGFEFVGDRKGFPRDSELIQGFDEAVKAGLFSKADISDDPSIFVGKRAFWERKPALWATQTRTDGKSAPDNLMPTRFIEDVGSKGKRKAGASSTGSTTAKSGAKSKSAAGEPEGPDEETVKLGVKLTCEVLDDLPPKKKTISREDLGSEVLALMISTYNKGPEKIDKETRVAIGELFETDEFLDENSGRKTWKYNAEDGEVTRL